MSPAPTDLPDHGGGALAASDQDLLARAYALDSDAASRALYRDWARSYDHTMLQGLQYQSPRLVAALFAHALPDKAAAVVDVGCGTGLVGRALAESGYRCIDGLDISPEMLAVARASSAYRQLLGVDLTAPLPLADGIYDGAVCAGTFTSGHVGAGCLRELLRILKPGAAFAFTVKMAVWESMGFAQTLQALQATGTVEALERRAGALYANSAEPDGWFCILHKRRKV